MHEPCPWCRKGTGRNELSNFRNHDSPWNHTDVRLLLPRSSNDDASNADFIPTQATRCRLSRRTGGRRLPRFREPRR